jgi:VanZ family protein
MSKALQIVLRWRAALLMMLIIFFISARTPSDLPNFEWADRIVKKGGHMIGYALLAISYWRAFHFQRQKSWLAWCLAILYAITDEFHQSFIPGRFPSVWDVLIFDNLGAFIGIGLLHRYKTQRPDLVRPIVEKVNAKG